MALSTILAGNPVPLILQAGETLVITLATNSSGNAAVPGQSVSTSMTAGGSYSFGPYSVQREVVVTLTAGTATADFSGEASGGLTPPQVAWVQSSASGGAVVGALTGVFSGATPIGVAIDGSEATAAIALLAALNDYYGNYASRAIPGLGAQLLDYKYSGGFIDFALDVTGNPTVGSGTAYTTVPTDAVGLELFLQSTNSAQRLYVATKAGVLSSTGVLATNETANNLGQRWVSGGGETLLIPFLTQGVMPTALRFAGNATPLRVGGRYISSATGFPYRTATNEQFSMVGAGAVQQFPFSNTTSFPVGYKGVQFRLNGPAGAMLTVDGSTPSASFGYPMQSNKTYLLDFETCGFAISALRIYLPAGNTIVGNSLFKV